MTCQANMADTGVGFGLFLFHFAHCSSAAMEIFLAVFCLSLHQRFWTRLLVLSVRLIEDEQRL